MSIEIYLDYITKNSVEQSVKKFRQGAITGANFKGISETQRDDTHPVNWQVTFIDPRTSALFLYSLLSKNTYIRYVVKKNDLLINYYKFQGYLDVVYDYSSGIPMECFPSEAIIPLPLPLPLPLL